MTRLATFQGDEPAELFGDEPDYHLHGEFEPVELHGDYLYGVFHPETVQTLQGDIPVDPRPFNIRVHRDELDGDEMGNALLSLLKSGAGGAGDVASGAWDGLKNIRRASPGRKRKRIKTAIKVKKKKPRKKPKRNVRRAPLRSTPKFDYGDEYDVSEPFSDDDDFVDSGLAGGGLDINSLMSTFGPMAMNMAAGMTQGQGQNAQAPQQPQQSGMYNPAYPGQMQRQS